MRILAIDTALGASSVAVLDSSGGAPLAFASEAMAKGHAEALLPIVRETVAGLEGGFPSLSRIAVTIGPGSFTGIRIGLSAARAFGLALNVRVIGVSTLSAYAAPLIAGLEGDIVAVAIDARHGNVFFQAFAPGGRTLVSPRVTSLKEAARAIGAGSVRLAGSAAAALALECWALGLKAQVADGTASPDIVWVARLGLAADPKLAEPKPLYLRPPNVTPPTGGVVERAATADP